MFPSKKSEVFLQLIFVTTAILISSIIGGVHWIRSLNAHMKTLEEDLKASRRDEFVYQQQPVDIVEDQEVPDCVCSPPHPTWKCGDGTDCAPDERVYTIKPCNPLNCNPVTESCEHDDFCCTDWEDVCDGDDCCGWNVNVVMNFNFIKENGDVMQIDNFDYENGACKDGHRLQCQICQMGGEAYQCAEDGTCIFTCLPNDIGDDDYKQDWCWEPTQPFVQGTNDIQVEFVNNCPGGPQPPPTDDSYCYAYCKEPFQLKNNSCRCPPCFTEENEGCELISTKRLIDQRYKNSEHPCDDERFGENCSDNEKDIMGTGIYVPNTRTCNGGQRQLAWLNHRLKEEEYRVFGGADDYKPTLYTICRKKQSSCEHDQYIEIAEKSGDGNGYEATLYNGSSWLAVGGGYQNDDRGDDPYTHVYQCHPKIVDGDDTDVKKWYCKAGKDNSNPELHFKCFGFFARGINGATLHTKIEIEHARNGNVETAMCNDSDYPFLLGGGYKSEKVDSPDLAPSWLVSQANASYDGWQCGISSVNGSKYEIDCYAVCGKIVLED